MQSNGLLVGLVYLTFNAPILLFLSIVPFGRRLSQALKEKSLNGAATESTSYSRVTGALGAVVVTSLFWSIGNMVLAHALAGDDKIPPLIRAVTPFFLTGSALFLPYVFNQLKTLIPGPVQAAASVQGAGRPGADQGASANASGPLRLIVANLSAQVSDAELARVLAAIGKQIWQHFEPEWKVGAILSGTRFALQGPQVAIDVATDTIIYLGDKSQDPYSGIAQVYGYHDRTHGATTVPYGFVYQDVCEAKGETWSIALSHEVLELLADPSATTKVSGPDPRVGYQGLNVDFEKEVCDPTQSDTYKIDGVPVVNFVTKAYFREPGGAPRTNHLGLPLPPFGLRPGGYYQFEDDSGPQVLSSPPDGPTQMAARALMGPYRRNARRASRPHS